MPKQPANAYKGRFINFDPTVHMGHLITALTVLVSAGIMWGTTLSDIHAMKDQIAKHEEWIEAVSKREDQDHTQTLDKIDLTMNQIRTEMNGWFQLIDKKIDGKADKR
jgi:hypothetical protein